MTDTTTCPICGAEATRSLADGDRYTFDCGRCGKYPIEGRLLKGLALEEPLASRLSGWLREQNLYGRGIPVITTYKIEILEKELPNYGPLEKQDKLLRAIEQLTNYPGDEVSIAIDSDIDASLAYARNRKELRYYLEALTGRGLVNEPYSLESHACLIITPEGWNYLALKPTDIKSKTQVFVAMSFDKELDSVYQEAIKPAIEETGYTPYRVDKEPHNEKIDMKIIAEILNSRFVVADVTTHKAGVYYEAGFAQGRDIPVIWSVKENDLGKVHFDTRQYAHIVWKDEQELKDQLQNHIRAIIGTKGPSTQT